MTDDRQDTRWPVTGEQVMKMIGDVDGKFQEWIRHDRVPAIRDFLDTCQSGEWGGLLGVYYVGDMGWVSEDEWDEVFAHQPEWARDAYMIEANEGWTDDMGLCEDIAAAYNEGGPGALAAWAEDMAEDGDLDIVFYSQFWNDELEYDYAEELADLVQGDPAAGTDATPAPDTPAPGMGV